MKEILLYIGISAKRYFPTEKVTQCNNNSNLVPRPSLTAPWNAACGQDWVSNQLSQTCYKVVLGKPKTWNEALWDCNQMGGTLLNIESVREQHYIQGELFQVFYFFWSKIPIVYHISKVNMSDITAVWNTHFYSHLLFLIFIFTLCNPTLFMWTLNPVGLEFHCIVVFSFASKRTLHFMIQWLFNTKTKMSFLNRDPQHRPVCTHSVQLLDWGVRCNPRGRLGMDQLHPTLRISKLAPWYVHVQLDCEKICQAMTEHFVISNVKFPIPKTHEIFIV